MERLLLGPTSGYCNLGARVSGRAGITGATEAGKDAAKIARYLEQGYSPRAAAELAKGYEGIGHHFVHRSHVNELIKDYGAASLRGRFLKAFVDSPWSVKRPTWMSKGEFYEWHARLHGGESFGRRTAQGARLLPGESWKAASVVEGLEPYGRLRYLWEASPTRLKVAAGGAVGGGSTAYFPTPGAESSGLGAES